MGNADAVGYCVVTAIVTAIVTTVICGVAAWPTEEEAWRLVRGEFPLDSIVFLRADGGYHFFVSGNGTCRSVVVDAFMSPRLEVEEVDCPELDGEARR